MHWDENSIFYGQRAGKYSFGLRIGWWQCSISWRKESRTVPTDRCTGPLGVFECASQFVWISYTSRYLLRTHNHTNSKAHSKTSVCQVNLSMGTVLLLSSNCCCIATSQNVHEVSVCQFPVRKMLHVLIQRLLLE